MECTVCLAFSLSGLESDRATVGFLVHTTLRTKGRRKKKNKNSRLELFPFQRRGYRHGDEQASRDHPEEEKTIRAVHTQKKVGSHHF